MAYLLAGILATIFLASATASDESCYNCAELFFDNPIIGGTVADSSILCTDDTMISCPEGTMCLTSLLTATVDIYGMGGEYKSLNSSCHPVDSDRNACLDERDALLAEGGTMDIKSCELGVDVQDNRLVSEGGDEEPAERVQCFNCMEYDMGMSPVDDAVNSTSIPCNDPITCGEGEVCNQILVGMASSENPEIKLKMKFGQCSPFKITCEFLNEVTGSSAEMMNVDVTSCDDEANFFTDNNNDDQEGYEEGDYDDQEGDSDDNQDGVKCFDCMEYDVTGMEGLEMSGNPCNMPITCAEGELCNQIQVDMASDMAPSMGVSMKFAQCGPAPVTCELVEGMVASYMDTMQVRITNCNDEANFFTDDGADEEGSDDDMDGESGDESADEDSMENDKFEIEKSELSGGKYVITMNIKDDDLFKRKNWQNLRKSIRAYMCGRDVKANVRLVKGDGKFIISGRILPKRERCDGCLSFDVGGVAIQSEICFSEEK